MEAKVGAYVKLSVPPAEVGRIKRDLTYHGFNVQERAEEQYSDYRRARYGIMVPRAYGRRYIERMDLEWEDDMADGSPIGELKAITLRDHQHEPVREMERLVKICNDFRIRAHTGSGKTVMACELARRLGITTTILVDQEFLMDQWVQTLTDLFECPRDRIGIVQGQKCEFTGKWFVVAMIQTLFRERKDEGLYSHSGLLVVDEAHTVGAEVFSSVLWQFKARTRIGISATPDRKDLYDNVLYSHLGDVEYKLQKEHTKSEVRFVETDFVPSWYASVSPKTGRYISECAGWGPRNELIVKAIQWLYNSGRSVLCMSERIEHLIHVKSLCIAVGLPEEDMGVVAGYDCRYGYEKDTSPKRKPKGWEKGTQYTPVKFGLIRKRIPKKVLKERKGDSRIVFATYGMFTKGVDVPHLSAGIDMTPRSTVEQVHGRILRPDEGKLTPIWVTIRDKNSYRAEYQFIQRLQDYQKSNAEIYKWDMCKGVKKQDLKVLRRKAKERYEILKELRIDLVNGRNVVTQKIQR